MARRDLTPPPSSPTRRAPPAAAAAQPAGRQGARAQSNESDYVKRGIDDLSGSVVRFLRRPLRRAPPPTPPNPNPGACEGFGAARARKRFESSSRSAGGTAQRALRCRHRPPARARGTGNPPPPLLTPGKRWVLLCALCVRAFCLLSTDRRRPRVPVRRTLAVRIACCPAKKAAAGAGGSGSKASGSSQLCLVARKKENSNFWRVAAAAKASASRWTGHNPHDRHVCPARALLCGVLVCRACTHMLAVCCAARL